MGVGVDLAVDLSQRGDRVTRLYRALRDALLDGRLRPGDRLPPSRDLAGDLGVSRATVTTAYERLVAEGHLVARVGAGTFVAEGAPSRPAPSDVPSDPLRPRRSWHFDPQPTSADNPKIPYDFRVGVPDAGLFPFAQWRRLVQAELRLHANGPGTYAPPGGHPALRAAIARYVARARSVRATPDDVVVTNGTQHALELVGRVLLEPGDVVAVEEPGYPSARALFESLGARVVGVPVDDEGLRVDDLPDATRLIHTTPSHQFPLGGAMSLARRTALLAWAARRQVAVLEDDYDSEFRFTQRPLDPLHRLDSHGRVLYLGTFSKTMLPALRTGFVVAPASLVPALLAARQLGDGFGQVALQAALARFVDDGLLARHVRRAGRVYEARRRAVLQALHGPLSPWLEVVPSAAGLHVAARARGLAADQVREALLTAADHGVVVEALADYCGESPTMAGVVIGVGAVATDRVSAGLALVADALRRLDPRAS